MISKTRLDALTDGVFAFAMTLLVLDLRLPEDFHPNSTSEFIAGLTGLSTQFLAYVISFAVLAFRWLAGAHPDEGAEHVSLGLARWHLLHLFFITCIPFSTMVVGRYVDFAPAIWLYAANTILSALAPLRMQWLAGGRAAGRPDRSIELAVLISSALLSVGISFVSPGHAMWAYLLNAATPWLRRRLHRTA